MRQYKYSQAYQISHDIDCFVWCDGQKYHIASNGGAIPDVITIKKNNKAKAEAYNKINAIWGDGAPQLQIVKKDNRLLVHDVMHTDLGYVFLTNQVDEFFRHEAGRYPESHDERLDFISSFFQMAAIGYISLFWISSINKYAMICEPYHSPNPDDDMRAERNESELVEFDISSLRIDNTREMNSPWQSYSYRQNG